MKSFVIAMLLATASAIHIKQDPVETEAVRGENLRVCHGFVNGRPGQGTSPCAEPGAPANIKGRTQP